MKNAKQILANDLENMVSVLQKVISFRSEKGEAAQGAPFGTEIKSCLDYVLNKATEFGFVSTNIDGYAGQVDFPGTGDEVLGILGHLDVVPAIDSEWKYPPYAGVVADGKLWGRGTTDDKGPMIACLFAAKALHDAGFKPSKTVRFIFGCDEESGMECVEHYFQKMPYPTLSFSPDGDFPVINREKGIYQFDVVCGKLPSGVSISAGTRANVVPSACVATADMDVLDVISKTRADELGVSVKIVDEKVQLSAVGKAAHGSTPDEGINAAHPVLKLLAEAYPQNTTLNFVANKIIGTDGANWGICLCDEASGKLTCNLGVLSTSDDGVLTATVDIRFPVSYNCNFMHDLLVNNTPAEFEVVPGHVSEPLFVPSDSDLVTSLMDVYNTATGLHAEPIAIGGGTYSRCLPNCVAFGPEFPGAEQTIHMPNEYIDLENLKLMSQIYLDAIYALAK